MKVQASIVCFLCSLTTVCPSWMPAINRKVREITYAIPTTFPYPVPTKSYPAVPTILPTSIMAIMHSSKPIRCSHKRAAAARRIPMTPDMLQALYQMKGGNWDDRYMAISEEDSTQHFTNMISVTEDAHMSNEYMPRHFNKRQLIEDLDNFHSWYSSVDPESTNDKTLSKLENDVAFSTEDVSKVLEKENVTIKDLKLKLNLTHSPLVLAQLLPRRSHSKRSADGTGTRTEYCSVRGNKTADGYLQMCSTCAATTFLSEDFFPKIINQAICYSHDTSCLTVQTVVHGKCSQQNFILQIMQRKPNKCRITIQNGAPIVMDDWVLYRQPIGVGCECTINKLSEFGKYIPPQS